MCVVENMSNVEVPGGRNGQGQADMNVYCVNLIGDRAEFEWITRRLTDLDEQLPFNHLGISLTSTARHE